MSQSGRPAVWVVFRRCNLLFVFVIDSKFLHHLGFAKIVLKPRNVTVKENGSALFNCNATGMPTPTIYWYYGKTNEPNSYKPISTNNSGIQRLPNNSLVLSSVTKNNQGWYRCLAGNPGNLELEAAYLKVGFDKAHSSPSMYIVFYACAKFVCTADLYCFLYLLHSE